MNNKIYVNTKYYYGYKNNIKIVYFDKPGTYTLSNELCGGDPCPGIKKSLYCTNWTLVCRDGENVHIDVETSKKLTRYNYKEGNFDFYVINLKHRTDRREHTIREFSRFNFVNLIFFDAVIDKPTWIGCAKSHLELIRYAKDNNMKYIFIIEDDCVLKPDISNDEYFDIFTTLATDYDKYEAFNGSPWFHDFIYKITKQPLYKYNSKINNNFYTIINAGQCAGFICTSYNIYDKLLNDYKWDFGHDLFYARFIKQLVYKRFIVGQWPNYSNTVEKYMNYDSEFNVSECLYLNLPIENSQL